MNKWTDVDRQAYDDLAHDIAFTVADGRKPSEADLASFRSMTTQRDLFLAAEYRKADQ